MTIRLEDISAELFSQWRRRLIANRQRGTLVISGDVNWCRQMAMRFFANSGPESICWISNIEQPDLVILNAKQALGLLGQEHEVIVFDAHAGFDADAFGAVSGTIVSGGLLVLLCPPLDEWPGFADPAAQSIAVWPYETGDLPGRFLQRMARLVAATVSLKSETTLVTPIEVCGAIVADEHSAKDSITDTGTGCRPECRTQDQGNAIAAIEHVLLGHRRRPLVLVADRGRGKSAALGIAAAQRVTDCVNNPKGRDLYIIVTAPRLAAVGCLFHHAAERLPEAETRPGQIKWKNTYIQFVAPDELCANLPKADLVLVDEAAAIPVSILQPLLNHYSRIVFSTTTHGYEGTGRGFAVRFRQILNEQTPEWTELHLQEPIRWAQGDPLERLVFDSLLLDAGCDDDDAALVAMDVATLTVQRISRDQLLDDEALLGQIFGLLVVAHYRTRPNDLRNLLDGPGLAIYIMLKQGAVLATALVSTEGGFDASLIEDIASGQRRPRGHLIPQSLVAHVGVKTAGELRCARVMRIAVHPALQRRGLGQQMLRHIKIQAKDQGADLLGASFGATPALLAFWRSESLWPVRVGFRRGKASGEHSVMVLSALSTAGKAVVAEARQRMLEDLPLCLADPLSQLDATIVAAFLLRPPGQQQSGQRRSDLPEMTGGGRIQYDSGRDFDSVCAFVNKARNYEDCLASIWRFLLCAALPDPQKCDTEQAVLINKVLQKQPWSMVAKRYGLAGKTEVLQCMRRGLLQLLEQN
ncbi:MAG: tRNA(Met) cytidine acetyltransferase [Ectothiorhodospiraceae bacterium]|nr:tRNA(Met) cytidine acetyltransferase [Ectothiorhodospiraceae bacterium]